MQKWLLPLIALTFLTTGYSEEITSDKKCEQGDLQECVTSGKFYSKLGKNDEALKFYIKACEGNNMLGCSGQGAMEYRQGNKVEAKKLFEKSCSKNEMKACEVLKNIAREEKLGDRIKELPNAETRNLLKAMRMDQQLSNVGTQMYEIAIKSFEEKNKQPMPEDIKSIIKKAIDEEAKTDDLLDMIIPFYEKTFTLVEINALTAFYKTPVAQKLIDEGPKLAQITAGLSQKWADKIIINIQEKIKNSPAPSSVVQPLKK